MPEYVIHRVGDTLNDHKKAVRASRILVVGLAYKPDVNDDRESPSYMLIDLLANRGPMWIHMCQLSDPLGSIPSGPASAQLKERDNNREL
jgi:UDP-N-acetyl-D-mannosaminuronate dehydrogenase